MRLIQGIGMCPATKEKGDYPIIVHREGSGYRGSHLEYRTLRPLTIFVFGF